MLTKDFLEIFKNLHIFADLLQWGCFGFDSIRHWTVSTPGVGGLPVNLSFQTISWQQLLRTRCLVYQVERLNLRGQGCSGDEYPDRLFRLFCPVKWGIIQTVCTTPTRLSVAKPKSISCIWPAFRQVAVENQRTDKRVESHPVRCLDGGSSPPISTKQKQKRI